MTRRRGPAIAASKAKYVCPACDYGCTPLAKGLPENPDVVKARCRRCKQMWAFWPDGKVTRAKV